MNRKQEPWMLTVKVGDVLRGKSGAERIVRNVTRFDDGELRAITFTIMRCSWTKRPYTVKNYTDLLNAGFYPVGVNVALDAPIDLKISDAIKDHHDRGLDCCIVRGIR